MPVASTAPRFLALWFPHLPVERHRRQPDCEWPAEKPAALVVRAGNIVRLAAVDRIAAGLGLGAGMPLADARACFPDLCVADADPALDVALLKSLARLALRLTPTTMCHPPDGLLLDIGASAHLFGGAAAIGARLATRLHGMGLTGRTGLASNPDAARAFARYGRWNADEIAAVHALPVEALGLPDAAAHALRRLGLKRVGDVAKRTGDGLAARFGTDAVAALARLLGELPAPLVPERPPPALRWVTRLPEPILTTDQAILHLEALLTRACRRLERLQVGGLHFEAVFSRTDGVDIRLGVRSSLPLRDARRIRRLFHERMDALRDPLDPGFGFDAVALSIPQQQPLAPEAIMLEADIAAAHDPVPLADLLAARFGANAVQRFHAVDTHIPERAAVVRPANHAAPAQPWPMPEPGEPPRRPILLFDPPQRIEVMAEVPDGPPHRFQWRKRLHQVRLAEGPERIASEWWRHAPGRRPGTRDYYRVEDCDGRRFWVFRNGLYTETGAPMWYLHGLFA